MMRMGLEVKDNRPASNLSGLTVIAMLLFLVMSVFNSPVLAQTSEDKRIEALEKELAQIKEDVKKGKSVDERIEMMELSIQQLKNDRRTTTDSATKMADSVADKSPGMSPEQLKEFRDRSAAASHVNYDADWNRGTPQDYVVDKNWIGLAKTPTELRLSGWVQVAAFTDFQEYGISGSQEFSSGAVIVPNNKESTTGMDAASSRIFFESRHLYESGNVMKTLFIVDGGGDGVNAGLGPRFRQANITINNLTFGLANGTFSNGSTWPAYLDRGAPGAYPLARKALIRYSIPLTKEQNKKHILTFGIEEPQSEVSNADSKTKWVDMVGRYDYNPKWGNLMGAVLVKNAAADSLTTTAGDEAWLWGAQVSGFFTFTPGKMKDHLKYGATYGTAIGDYLWDSSIGGTPAGVWNDYTQSIETQKAFGIWAGYERNWSSHWSSLFMASYVDVNNSEINPGSAFDKATTYAATLAWAPWPTTYFALEYFYGKRWNFDDQSGYNNRLNFVLRHNFNR